MKSLCTLSNLSIGHRQKALLTGLNASMHAHDLIALVGRNGMGKTTLIRTIAGLLSPIAGEILIAEKPIFSLKENERAKMVSIVLTQRPQLSGIDVFTLIMMGRHPHGSRLGWTNDNDAVIAFKCLEQLNISHLKDRTLDQLSDGEMQKVMIARALAQQTPIIILDEPTAFLDYVAKEELFVLLKQVARENEIAILFSSHDLDLVEKFATRTWTIADGVLHQS
jgi:iron complex transport system ATP-binding protein